MPRSKKIEKKSPEKKVKPVQTKENKKPKETKKSPEKKVKSPPTQTKENKKSPDKKVKPTQTKVKPPPTQTKENKQSNVVEEDIRKIQKVVSVVDKEKSVSPQHQRKRSNSLELFDKYAYDIYTEDEKRHEALGNLVIAFGPTELIKKLDSENMKSPNMSHKFNYDKKWVRDNFKSEKR